LLDINCLYKRTGHERNMNIAQKLIQPLFRIEAQRHLLYGKRRRALALFNILCKWSPTPDNKFNLALCMMNLREYEPAIELLEPIHKLIPNQLFAGITYAQCLMLAKHYPEAEEVYQHLSDLNPENNLLKVLLGLVHDPVGRDKFITSLDYQYQASLLQEEKHPLQALEILRKAVELTPDDAALHNNIGALKLKLKYPKAEVMADFYRAMQLSPDNDRYKRNYRKVWQKNPS
jgi:tetratricopeptide (TPR) repeat protein